MTGCVTLARSAANLDAVIQQRVEQVTRQLVQKTSDMENPVSSWARSLCWLWLSAGTFLSIVVRVDHVTQPLFSPAPRYRAVCCGLGSTAGKPWA